MRALSWRRRKEETSFVLFCSVRSLSWCYYSYACICTFAFKFAIICCSPWREWPEQQRLRCLEWTWKTLPPHDSSSVGAVNLWDEIRCRHDWDALRDKNLLFLGTRQSGCPTCPIDWLFVSDLLETKVSSFALSLIFFFRFFSTNSLFRWRMRCPPLFPFVTQ